MKKIKDMLIKFFNKKEENIVNEVVNIDYKEIEIANNRIRYSVCGEYTHFSFPDEGKGLTVASYTVKGISPNKYSRGLAQGSHYGTILSTDIEDYILELNKYGDNDV
jgi:hypothetical protein